MEEQSQTGAEQLKDVFESRLLNCGHVLVMLDDFAKPHYITRLWCVFETYVSLKKEVPITFILPASTRARFDRLLEEGGISEVRMNYQTLDARLATASYKADQDMIKEVIDSTIGFDVMNEMVKKYMLRWVTNSFMTYMAETPR